MAWARYGPRYGTGTVRFSPFLSFLLLSSPLFSFLLLSSPFVSLRLPVSPWLSVVLILNPNCVNMKTSTRIAQNSIRFCVPTVSHSRGGCPWAPGTRVSKVFHELSGGHNSHCAGIPRLRGSPFFSGFLRGRSRRRTETPRAHSTQTHTHTHTHTHTQLTTVKCTHTHTHTFIKMRPCTPPNRLL